jgi:hypothetical protein
MKMSSFGNRNPVPTSKETHYISVNAMLRFDVFTVVTMKNSVVWDLKLCGSCKNRRFGGTYRHHHQGDKNRRSKNVSSMDTPEFLSNLGKVTE